MKEDRKFSRLQIAIGKESVDILKKKHVAVFGLGGVGGFALESLARSAIGKVTIVDYDKVDISNINRQLIADTSTVDRYKTDVFEERLLKINPEIEICKMTKKYTSENREEFFLDYDYIVDAIDMVTSKIDLLKTAYERNIPIISSMGMGNKLNPTLIKVATIEKTSVCKLARVIRRELKKYNIKGIKCVYSTEETQIREKVVLGDKMVNGSTSFVPSVAGLIMTSEIIRYFIKEEMDFK